MNDNPQNTQQTLLDFAQFLASQDNADSIKAQFDAAYHLARYEVKLRATCKGRWMRVSECPRMSEGK